MLSLAIVLTVVLAAGSPPADLRAQVDALRHQARQELAEWTQSQPWKEKLRSDWTPLPFYEKNPTVARLRALGPAAVPYFLECLDDEFCPGALSHITKWRWHEERYGNDPRQFYWTIEELPGEKWDDLPSLDLWPRWWKEVRSRIPELFAQRVARWRELKQAGKTDDAAKELEKIQDLGLDTLPLIVAEVEKGEDGLIPALAYLSDAPWAPEAKLAPASTREQCVQWWTKNKDKYIIPKE